MIRIGRFEPSWQSIQRVYLPRIADTAEIREPGENSQRRRQRQSELFSDETATCAVRIAPADVPKNSNVVRGISFQEFLVHRNHVVDRCRERILWG